MKAPGNQNKARRTRGATRKTVRRPTVNVARLLPLTIGAFVVLAAVLLVPRLDISFDRPVTVLEVIGDFKYLPREQVIEAVQPFIADDYLSVSLDEVRQSLEALPWVYQAAVRREWPGKLEVSVIEQKPIAWWGKTLLMNNKGGVFAPGNIEMAEPLPYLEGPVGKQAQVMGYYIDIGQVLRSRDITIRSLRLSERGAWRASLASGTELIFGRDHVMEKLQRFLVIFDNSLVRYFHRVTRVDMRYQNGVAVAWNGVKK